MTHEELQQLRALLDKLYIITSLGKECERIRREVAELLLLR